jgi:drug/metabolite transporter (DMT)-like permease
MTAILSPRIGIPLLMLLASIFAANHIAARVAFDHGASVAAAVAVRSGITALVKVLLLRIGPVPEVYDRAVQQTGRR